MGKTIPGVLRLIDPEHTPVALVVDSPHSGREYPDDYGYSCSFDELRSAEDAYVDVLCEGATAAGASLLVADFPRAYADANRHEDDINPALVDGAWDRELKPGPKTLLGIGFARERLSNGAWVYDRKISPVEFEHRIREYHRPYHATLAALLNATRERFGRVWHLDMHSMASFANVVTPDAGAGVREFDMVLGDLDGTSCEPALRDVVYQTLCSQGYRVQVNDPYKGAEITRRYGAPANGVHTMQIEMNRALYLDEKTTQPNEGFAELKANLSALFQAVAKAAPA